MKLLLMVLVLLCVGCKESSNVANKPSYPRADKVVGGSYPAYRFYDDKFNIVCYRAVRSISCVKLDDTKEGI